MKKILISLSIALMTYASYAQTGIVKGRVTDDEKVALPGATIVSTNSEAATIADVNGFFTLTGVEAGTQSIMVSYLGYKEMSQEVEVVAGKSTVLNFELISGVEIGEVVVRGNLPGQARALNYQKENTHILNVISSDQVGQFPDANIGDAMKRVSGINVQYDQGEARFANIRGTAPELSSVTINGTRIPSAEAENRSVQLDLIPSEMIQTIEVNKVVTPDMDADAIGGSVNLVSRATPSGRRIAGQLGSGYNQISGRPQMKGSLLYAERVADEKIGFTLSASVFDHKLGSDNHEAEWDEDGTLKEFQIRQYYLERLRQSYSGAVDFNINEDHKIMVKGMYNQRDDWENRYRLRFNDLDADNMTQTEIRRQTKGGSKDNKYGRLEKQKTYNASLSGDHSFGKITLDWYAAYNKASEERPNERYISMQAEDVPVTTDISDPENVKITPDAQYSDLNTNYELKEITEENQYTEEANTVARINLTIPLMTGKYSNKVKVGGAYLAKDKLRDNEFFEYEPVDEDAFVAEAVANIEDQSKDGFMANEYSSGSFVKKEYLGDLNLSDANLFDSEEILEEIAGNYEATENITAAYLRFDQKVGSNLDIIAGVRMENTTNEYAGYVYNDNEDTGNDPTLDPTGKESKDYTNILPSAILRYRLTKNANIKAAWTNTISRPRYFELVPYQQIIADDEEIFFGNPELEPTKSMNIDILGELYFTSVGVVSGGFFYKNITDHIITETFTHTNGYDAFRSINGMDATLLGLEFAIQRQLDFLPSFLKYLGVYANYTFTQSEATNFEIEGREGEKVAMSGSPENMLNASIAFDNDKLSVRLSYNYASEFVDEYGEEAYEDVYYDKVTYLDLNANYQITKSFNAFLNINNILNQPLRYYQGESKFTYQVEYYGATISGGVGFKF